jgi:ergothioneine biosynthesis protein EgtB
MRSPSLPRCPRRRRGGSQFPTACTSSGTKADFAFDNEGPRHSVYLHGGRLAHRLVTNAEYAAFIADGGYRQPMLWLSAGWGTVQEQRWQAPLYWEQHDGAWHEFTLAGLAPIVPNAPVTHVSYYEADAFARWAGCRLPLEGNGRSWHRHLRSPVASWSTACRIRSPRRRPACSSSSATRGSGRRARTWGTRASPSAGAIGEYNGKFMSDQWVLRGASCATPRSHARHSYRNFFPSDARWQFTGIRLAADA